ncbi:MAG: hypothetical protein OXR73_07970 [Myxococcales bacterium]|nr:hypothetical protein [Myxococcales bacterium]
MKLHGGQFTGSGVILGVGIEGGRGRMVVATAAHNLRVQIDGLTGKARTDFWGGGAQPWSLQEMTQRQQSMIAAFCRDVSIHYDAADMTVDDPTAEAGVATIHTVKMGAFTYDACLLFADFGMDRGRVAKSSRRGRTWNWQPTSTWRSSRGKSR